jgi:hypothetical protein
MLPALSSSAGIIARLRHWGVGALLLLCLLLPLALGGCGGIGQPPRAVLLQALTLQIQLTQDAIAQALQLEVAGEPELTRVRLERQQEVPIGAAKGLRLQGRFDWRLAGDPIRLDTPFELYLQRGERGQSWRLVRPSGPGDDASQEWFSYPLPLRG